MQILSIEIKTADKNKIPVVQSDNLFPGNPQKKKLLDVALFLFSIISPFISQQKI